MHQKSNRLLLFMSAFTVISYFDMEVLVIFSIVKGVSVFEVIENSVDFRVEWVMLK